MFLSKLYNLSIFLIEYFYVFFCTFLMKIFIVLQQVHIGEKYMFDGRTIFKKGSKNTIKIGNNCKFLSRQTSNLIGINRPCILSSIGDMSSLIIGDNCGFSGTVIGCFSKIIIGDNVRCGANTLITDSDWHLSDYRSSDPKPIIINNNVFQNNLRFSGKS